MTIQQKLWQRLIEADYNRRYYVRSRKIFGFLNRLTEGAIAFSSSGAVVALAQSEGADLPMWLSVLSAALAAIALACSFADKAGECRAQAKLWAKLMQAFRDKYERAAINEPVSDEDVQRLDNQFDHLFAQEQHDPPQWMMGRVMHQTLRSWGYSESQIKSFQDSG